MNFTKYIYGKFMKNLNTRRRLNDIIMEVVGMNVEVELIPC